LNLELEIWDSEFQQDGCQIDTSGNEFIQNTSATNDYRCSPVPRSAFIPLHLCPPLLKNWKQKTPLHHRGRVFQVKVEN
jgi:hypothetical protein